MLDEQARRDAEKLGREAFQRSQRGEKPPRDSLDAGGRLSERDNARVKKDQAAWIATIAQDQARRVDQDREARYGNARTIRDYQSYLDALNVNNDHHGALRRGVKKGGER